MMSIKLKSKMVLGSYQSFCKDAFIKVGVNESQIVNLKSKESIFRNLEDKTIGEIQGLKALFNQPLLPNNFFNKIETGCHINGKKIQLSLRDYLSEMTLCDVVILKKGKIFFSIHE